MTIFAIIRVADPPKMAAAIESNFPDNFVRLQDDEWLVSGTGTAREVSDKLGITTSGTSELAVGSALVLTVGGGYYGRASTVIWDWIKTKLESSSSG